MRQEYKQLAVKMESEQNKTSTTEETNQEYRVQVTSKKHVVHQISKYKDILKTALDGQPAMAEDTKRVVLQELLAVGVRI